MSYGYQVITCNVSCPHRNGANISIIHLTFRVLRKGATLNVTFNIFIVNRQLPPSGCIAIILLDLNKFTFRNLLRNLSFLTVNTVSPCGIGVYRIYIYIYIYIHAYDKNSRLKKIF